MTTATDVKEAERKVYLATHYFSQYLGDEIIERLDEAAKHEFSHGYGTELCRRMKILSDAVFDRDAAIPRDDIAELFAEADELWAEGDVSS